jgi:hypothetical protein
MQALKISPGDIEYLSFKNPPHSPELDKIDN